LRKEIKGFLLFLGGAGIEAAPLLHPTTSECTMECTKQRTMARTQHTQQNQVERIRI